MEEGGHGMDYNLKKEKVVREKRGLECSRVAREYDLYKSLGDIDMCKDFDMFKVKVPVISSGMEGFPLRRDGRYETFFNLIFRPRQERIRQRLLEQA
jgi:hypothetical protein